GVGEARIVRRALELFDRDEARVAVAARGVPAIERPEQPSADRRFEDVSIGDGPRLAHEGEYRRIDDVDARTTPRSPSRRRRAPRRRPRRGSRARRSWPA